MNQQNINSLITFIGENQDTSLEQLLSSCLKAGYTQEEFNQALVFLGKEPSSSLYQTSLSSSIFHGKSAKTILLIVISIIFLAGLTVGIFVYYGHSANRQEIISQTPTPPLVTIIPSSSPSLTQTTTIPTGVNATDNPLTLFMQTLRKEDYKVTAMGKVEYEEKTVERKESSGSASLTSKSSLNLNNTFFYLKKGEMVRTESNNPEQEEVYFLKDDKIFYLQPNKKTYLKYNPADEWGQFLLMVLKLSFPLLSLADESEKKLISWQKVEDNQWQADWKFHELVQSKDIPARVKITQDPATNLITTLSYRFNETQSWQDFTFSYQKTPEIDTYLMVPPDYQEEKPSPAPHQSPSGIPPESGGFVTLSGAIATFIDPSMMYTAFLLNANQEKIAVLWVADDKIQLKAANNAEIEGEIIEKDQSPGSIPLILVSKIIYK